jgi:hypothetical protein
MKTILTMISAGLLFISTSCNKTSEQDMQPANDNSISSSERPGPYVNAFQLSTIMFNGTRYTAQLRAYPYSTAIAADVPDPAMIAPTINTMFVIKETVLPGTVARFVPVVSALPTGGFTSSTLWRQVYVTFTSQVTKSYQLLSADEITKMLLVQPNAALVATNTDFYFQMQLAGAIDQPAITR